jgi:uncharacterized protein (TIGR00251 family)
VSREAEDGPFKNTSEGVSIMVHAQPGAKRTEVVGMHGGSLKIRIQAPPLDGKANDELVRFFAKILNVTRSDVKMIRGDKSREKVFVISDMDDIEARKKLLPNS